MSGMVDLAPIFELINDGLNDGLNERAFAQEQLVGVRREDVAHVLAGFDTQLRPMRKEEALCMRRRDVALATEQSAEEAARQGTPITDVSRSQATRRAAMLSRT
jgi:hypothetical protein